MILALADRLRLSPPLVVSCLIVAVHDNVVHILLRLKRPAAAWASVRHRASVGSWPLQDQEGWRLWKGGALDEGEEVHGARKSQLPTNSGGER